MLAQGLARKRGIGVVLQSNIRLTSARTGRVNGSNTLLYMCLCYAVAYYPSLVTQQGSMPLPVELPEGNDSLQLTEEQLVSFERRRVTLVLLKLTPWRHQAPEDEEVNA